MIRVHANGVSEVIVGMRADRTGICRKLFKKAAIRRQGGPGQPHDGP
jgi:hypothetical protein